VIESRGNAAPPVRHAWEECVAEGGGSSPGVAAHGTFGARVIAKKRGATVRFVDEFDPLGDLSKASFAKPVELDPVNLRVLSPFQRALLVIDGTVTKFIEAYAMEPVIVARLGHERRPVPEHREWLDLAEGAEVAIRQVAIRGAYTGALYVYAVSYVVLDRLPESVCRRLEIQGEGLGRILHDEELETRREILWFGREHLDQARVPFQAWSEGEFISRAYRIIASGKPIALINERFPMSVDTSPSHH
jgi:chorismate-pyruvate lyase